MKKTNFLCAAALIIALVMAFTGCRNTEQGFGLPGDAGDKNDVKTQSGAFPSEKTAYELLENVLEFNNLPKKLKTYNSTVLDAAFKRQEGMGLEKWIDSKLNASDFSFDVELKEADNSDVKDNVIITGRSKASYKSNKTLFQFASVGLTSKGDNVSYSSSVDKKADFSNKEIKFSSLPLSAQYSVYGIIKVESNDSTDKNVKEISAAGPTKNEESKSQTKKLSAVLSISDGTNTAKYKFSYAESYSNSMRNVNSSVNYEEILSDIEVYSGNDLKYTIVGSDLNVSSLLSSLEDFSLNNSNY